MQQACDDDNSLPTRAEEPEESAAEKIYATLRECREQADPKRQKGVKMQGYLLKKKEKIGKWKQQFFLLKQDGTDSHLYFYDNPKVKFVIEQWFSFSFLSLIHSFFLNIAHEAEGPYRPELRLPLPSSRQFLREAILLPTRRAGAPLPGDGHLPRVRRRRRVRGLDVHVEAHVRAADGTGAKGRRNSRQMTTFSNLR